MSRRRRRTPLLTHSTGGARAARASAWSPFRHGLFRALWIAPPAVSHLIAANVRRP
jgi:hypothetical protein